MTKARALAPRTEAILRLAHATAFGTRKAVRAALVALRRAGGSSRDAAEVFALESAFCGWPTCLFGFARLLEDDPAFRPAARRRPKDRSAARRAGIANFRAVYGRDAPAILGRIRRYDEALAALLLEVPYGEIYARAHLSLRTKELVACLLLASSGRKRELRGHLMGALRAGASVRELDGVMTIVDEASGKACGIEAAAALRRVLRERSDRG